MFIRDALRFISAFIVPISESAPQIYLSALPFAPKRSLVVEKFCPRFPNTLTISNGRPSQWPMIVFVAEHYNNCVSCIVLSPDEKTFASISDSATMYICDSETGHCISGPFNLRNQSSMLPKDACFSPDGKYILVRCHSYDSSPSCAVVWNIEKEEEEIEGFDFVFIHCGHNEGRIASMDRIHDDYDESTVAPEERPTCIWVKLWDIGNRISDRLFMIMGMNVARFSPNGKYLAVARQFESVVELWNLEDGTITHRFSCPRGDPSSLRFSPTSDCLMAAFIMSCDICLWRLDTQEMVCSNLDVRWTSPAVIHLPYTIRVFVPRDHTVEIWEVSRTGLNMVFETEPLTTESSICPSGNGHRLLMGSEDGTVRMWNLEDLGSNQPVIQDDMDIPYIIAFSSSGKIVATISQQSTYIELRDMATWELVGPRDVEYGSEVIFSADDNRIAVLSESLATIWDINHPENRLSFDPWPEGRSVRIRQAAFQTCNDLVICAQLKDNDSHVISGLLQVWKVKDHSQCMFSLVIDIGLSPLILPAPDGLTIIIESPTLCYSWNHNTAQFDRIHFADEAHLGPLMVYSPDGKLCACRSWKDNNVRVWDTRTGQLCGKPITMSVNTIALSPALNDQSLGDQLIALRRDNTDIITLFDVHTGNMYAQFWDPGWEMAFIQDGTKLMSYDPIRIYDIADFAAKHQNATQPVPRYTRDGWMVGQDNELLFWAPFEHRRVLYLPHVGLPRVEIILGRLMKVDLSNFKFGTEWTECIDQEWLKELNERGKWVGKLHG